MQKPVSKSRWGPVFIWALSSSVRLPAYQCILVNHNPELETGKLRILNVDGDLLVECHLVGQSTAHQEPHAPHCAATRITYPGGS